MAEGGKKPRFYVATVSWGKDSCAMVEVILAHLDKYPLNLVLFINTGYEFEAVYDVRDMVVAKLAKYNIPYVEISIKARFDYMMFEHVIDTRDGSEKVGYKWCGGPCRWGTSLKLQEIARYIRENLAMYDVYEYVGYAADELERVEANTAPNKLYPLVEGGITEARALRICYECGYTYREKDVYLYEILKRLSCWLCANKNLEELRAYYYLLPDYFEKLKELQLRMPDMPMKGEAGSVFDLEKRFKKEGRNISIFDEYICLPEELRKKEEVAHP